METNRAFMKGLCTGLIIAGLVLALAATNFVDEKPRLLMLISAFSCVVFGGMLLLLFFIEDRQAKRDAERAAKQEEKRQRDLKTLKECPAHKPLGSPIGYDLMLDHIGCAKCNGPLFVDELRTKVRCPNCGIRVDLTKEDPQ